MPLIPVPPLADLPLQANDPPFSAWGLWAKHGFDAQLGSLNYLTDEVVLKAMKEEVKIGQRFGLNLPLDFIEPPLFGRASFSKRIIRKDPRTVNDDEITINTQSSSQWDSLRHFGYQSEAVFYNGVTQDQIHANGGSDSVNGLDAWASRCIAGRAVLIDYATYAEKNHISYDALDRHAIPLQAIKDIAEECHITFQTGDILLLRTGFTMAYSLADDTRRRALADRKPPQLCGFGQGREATEWLWERQFSAVAGDSVGFECSPALEPEWQLHPILLAGWGTPIGELWDLEALAAACQEQQRWTMFLTSAPLNFHGAVASPPNAIAFL